MTDMKEYASALFLLCKEENTIDTVRAELDALKQVLAENPEYTKLLDTPAMKKEERLALAEVAFGGFSEYLLNVILILAERHLASGLPRLCDEFASLFDEERGILRAEAVTAVAMSDEQVVRLAEKLGERTGKTVIIKNTVDPAMLGGVKLRYGGTQLDGTVKASLDRFERALEGSVI